ncbi:hypothetical protein V8G54_034679 [Vigna mungo]|uniref:DUF8039 domain-containing protein n=1 Tax=Vigna mungo TaxID=3915 RepID=A0AAQ3MDQ0_VIGMU
MSWVGLPVLTALETTNRGADFLESLARLACVVGLVGLTILNAKTSELGMIMLARVKSLDESVYVKGQVDSVRFEDPVDSAMTACQADLAWSAGQIDSTPRPKVEMNFPRPKAKVVFWFRPKVVPFRPVIEAVAIGRPEHPGYIRGVGRGVGLKQFFGGPTRKITSLGFAIQGAPKGASHVASTKGSCPEESRDGVDVPVDCELYVDDPHWHLVALGKIYNLGSTIHHEAIKDYMLRVVVVDIKDSSARVPLPSEEVQTVGQAPGNFIIWPARLAKPILDVSKKKNIATTLQPQLSPLQQLGAAVVTMGNKTIEIDMPPELTCKTATTTLFVCHRDICEIVIGNDLLSTTVLQLWNLYLHHLCIERRNTTIFGFLDPVIIQSVGNKSEEVQKYLIEMFEKDGKEILIISAGLKTSKLLRQSTRTLVPHPFIDFSSNICQLRQKAYSQLHGDKSIEQWSEQKQ